MGEGDGIGWAPVPGLAEAEAAAPATELRCVGETFALRPDGRGGTHYAWLTGPNPGYGFTVSPTLDDDVEQHEEHIRSFLSMIDPETGYIAED